MASVGFFSKSLFLLLFFGRGERIRTSDPLHPMQVRYQAALRPVDQANKYSRLFEAQERSERKQLTA